MAHDDTGETPVLPDGWVWTALEELIDALESGGRPKGGVKGFTEGVPSIGGEHILWTGGFDFQEIRFIPRDFFLKMTRGVIRKHDVLVVKDGATTGKTSFVSDDFPFNEAAVNEHVFILRVPEQDIDPKYIFYWLRSPYGQQCIKDNFQGTAQGGINSLFVRNSHVPLCSLPEQRRIVAEIETQITRLEAGVAALKRAQARLRRYKAAVLQAACEGRLVPTDADLSRRGGVTPPQPYEPAQVLLQRILAERRAKWDADHPDKRYQEPTLPDPSDLPELPEGWVWTTVELLAALEPNSITDGPFGSKLKTTHYTDSGPRVIRLQNIGDAQFLDEKAHISQEHFESLRKHQVYAGDLVIAALGATLPRACIIPESVGPAIVKADCIRFKPDPKLVHAKYLHVALNSEPLRQIATSIIHGVGRPRLNQQEIKSLPVQLPPLAEQHRIVAEVERRLSVVGELEKQVEAALGRAERLRQAILKRAFEGRLVPQDPNDDPASALLEQIRAERTKRMPHETKPRMSAVQKTLPLLGLP